MHLENQICISTDTVERHIKILSEEIGVRLAGSLGEKRAEEYIAAELTQYGVEALIERFPIQERAVEKETLHIELKGKWHSFPCSLLGNAMGTNGKTIAAVVNPATVAEPTENLINVAVSHPKIKGEKSVISNNLPI